MMNSLLNAARIDSLLLTILIVLGVVIAGALIVYLLWEVVMAVSRKSKNENVELRFDNKKETAVKSGVVAEDYVLDQNETKQIAAEQMVVVGSENISEDRIVDVDEVRAEEEKNEFERENADKERENAERRAYLEARRQELLKRMQMETEEEDEEEAVEETRTEEEAETEVQAEAVKVAEAEEVEEEETAQEEPAEEVVAQEEIVEENKADLLEEERKALEIEKEKYAAMVRELEVARKMLADQTKAQAEKEPVVETIVTNESALSLEEIKEKLAVAEERLKATEKEFKQCKKEYIPLKRVWNTYEKDQKKLRRKEALVAKQKVLLYGVNNYADIDPDKANKLAEDLDLLDGLKLSVQHCEEVMKKNEERYPLLEKMYNVLKLRNDELKRDIAIYREAIEKAESEDAE